MKFLKIVCLSLFVFIFLFACSANNSDNKKIASHLDINKVYQNDSDMYFKLVDQQHFVAMSNRANYQTQEELSKFQNSQEVPSSYLPNILFWEGTYEKVGRDYQLVPKRSVIVEFKDVDNIGRKIIYRKYEENLENNQEFLLVKSHGGGLQLQNKSKDTVYQSDMELPNSVDDFLAQYKYEPEELE